MRITNVYLANNMLANIQNNLGQMARSQEQISSGSQLLRASDKPELMGQFMALKSTLNYNDQYDRNIQDGLSYMSMTDTSMGTLGDVIHQASDYAVQAANGTYNEEDRKAIADQIDKMIDEVVDLGNTTAGGKYIYAGTQNGSAPFSRDGDKIIYQGNLEAVQREVMGGTNYRIDAPAVSETGVGVFGNATADGETYVVYDGTSKATGGPGIFNTLFALRDRLNNNDTAGISESIGDLSSRQDDLLSFRTAEGGRYQHFESLSNVLQDQDTKLEGNLSNIDSADIGKLSIQYAQQQLSYNASLAVGSNMMKTSLLDYLR